MNKILLTVTSILLLLSVSSAQSDTRYCINNQTLRVQESSIVSIEDGNCSSCSYNYTRYQDYPCAYNCTNSTSPASCNSKSMIDGGIFLVVTFLSAVLMFFIPSAIVNIIGSLMMMVEGGYMIVSGIDIQTASISLAGTVNTFTLNSALVYTLSFILIGLSLYKLAAAYSRMHD